MQTLRYKGHSYRVSTPHMRITYHVITRVLEIRTEPLVCPSGQMAKRIYDAALQDHEASVNLGSLRFDENTWCAMIHGQLARMASMGEVVHVPADLKKRQLDATLTLRPRRQRRVHVDDYRHLSPVTAMA